MSNRNEHLPLTETTFYILTALAKPSHGYEVMQTVETLSKGDVRIAAGTMYGALENLLKQGLIKSVPSADPRRKTYQISPKGKAVLNDEVSRLEQLIKTVKSWKGMASLA